MEKVDDLISTLVGGGGGGGATITSERIPQGLSVDGVRSLDQVDEHGVEVDYLFKAFLLYLPHCKYHVHFATTRADSTLGFWQVGFRGCNESVQDDTSKDFPAIGRREIPL